MPLELTCTFYRLKWKPPSENSIDFKLVLRFPPLAGSPTQPDLHAKPIFALHVWGGGEAYEPWDTMHVDDDEWERCVASPAYMEMILTFPQFKGQRRTNGRPHR